MPANPIKALDAHAGQWLAQLPTQWQSAQRYAQVRGICCIELKVMGSLLRSSNRWKMMAHKGGFWGRADPFNSHAKTDAAFLLEVAFSCSRVDWLEPCFHLRRPPALDLRQGNSFHRKGFPPKRGVVFLTQPPSRRRKAIHPGRRVASCGTFALGGSRPSEIHA